MSKTTGSRKKIIRIGLIITILLFVAVSCIASKLIYDNQFPRYDRPDERITAQLRYSDIATDYPRKLVQFASEEHLLQGYIYGESNSRALMVIAHGIGGGADSYLPHIKHFVDKGLRVFAYDSTGSYASEGKSTKGFPQSIVDLHAALNYIENQSNLASLPILLFGHSWGGYAVANVLHYPHDVSAVISVSGVSNAMDILMEQGKSMMGFFIYTQYPFLWLYQRLLFGKVADFDAVHAINEGDTPVLIIHGLNDEMVSYHNSALIAQKEKITNAHVSYITGTTLGRDGHNNLFRTDAAITYVDEVNASYRTVFDSYDGNIPYEVKKSFYDGIDRMFLQQLEPSLMNEIDTFIDNALQR